MVQEEGTVYFFTGLAGAGKTTIGGLFYKRLKARKPDVILIDGDKHRAKKAARMGIEAEKAEMDDSLYTTEYRKNGAWKLFKYCKKLVEQGRDVVCCSISMYSEIRDWNRNNINNYKEIYVKVKWETLLARNQKGLYSPGRKNVVGVDLPFDEPDTPDVTIQNDGGSTPEEIVERLESVFGV